ncbi:MAG TPA: hypothetical protein VMF30_08010 [Pirellulales bacterium]|nr:hypothetical protein [Pirellulales bacterium]
MSIGYSRKSPSPRYRELLAHYADMHQVTGERFQNVSASKTYPGDSMPRHTGDIKMLIDAHGARTILDYGSGKGVQYQQVTVKLPDGRMFPTIPAFWGVDSVTCYDPAYEPFKQLPQIQFDGVVCTDVLEHIPEDDLPWIVGEIFAFARRFVYVNVACYPAMKRLPNGENAHCTVRPTAWWDVLVRGIAARYTHVAYRFSLDHLVRRPDGAQKMVADILAG